MINKALKTFFQIQLQSLYCVLFFLIFSNAAIGQDLHFSQFNRTPLFLNPALTGSFEGDIRVMSIFRNQWQTIPVPYNSIGASIDYNLPVRYQKDKLGLGLQAIMDRAGDGRFTTSMFSFSSAYHFTAGSTNPFILSIGGQANWVQRSYDPNRLTFDNQFNGDYFDPTRPIGEQLDRTQLQFFDFNLGTNANFTVKQQHVFNFGFSIAHFHQTQQNFIDISTNTLLQKRYNFYLSANISIIEKLKWLPIGFYQLQDGKYEYVLGSGLQYVINNDRTEKLNITLGLSGRLGDAFIPWLHFEKKNISAQLSIDFNTSPLRIASNSYGGIEFSLGYLIKYRKDAFNQYDFCPYIWF